MDPNDPSKAKQTITDEMAKRTDLGLFIRGYTQALGFTAHLYDPEDDSGESLFTGSGDFEENWDVWYEVKDLLPDDDAQLILTESRAFMEEVKPLLAEDFSNWERLGTDFLFSRNGHGTGFWDRPDDRYGEIQNDLDAKAKVWSTCDMEGQRDADGELISVNLRG